MSILLKGKNGKVTRHDIVEKGTDKPLDYSEPTAEFDANIMDLHIVFYESKDGKPSSLPMVYLQSGRHTAQHVYGIDDLESLIDLIRHHQKEKNNE